MTMSGRVTDSRQSVDAPGELDRLLGAFFRSEMPAAWPDLPVPEKPRRSPVGSRLVLAASILLLLVSQVGISSRFGEGVPASVEPEAGKLEATRRQRSGMPKVPAGTARSLATPKARPY